MEKHRISLNVTGAKLLGFGNACPYNPDGYLKTTTGTYYGEALFIVRAEIAVEICVKAKDESGTKGEITIPVVQREFFTMK